MNDPLIRLDCIFGHVKIVNAYKVEGDALHMGGYSITYDRNGNEVSRTEPTYHVSITMPKPSWHDELWCAISPSVPLVLGFVALVVLLA